MEAEAEAEARGLQREEREDGGPRWRRSPTSSSAEGRRAPTAGEKRPRDLENRTEKFLDVAGNGGKRNVFCRKVKGGVGRVEKQRWRDTHSPTDIATRGSYPSSVVGCGARADVERTG